MRYEEDVTLAHDYEEVDHGIPTLNRYRWTLAVYENEFLVLHTGGGARTEAEARAQVAHARQEFEQSLEGA
jgi:hypothetical protein